MSTKIWEAYEVRRGFDPWDAFVDIKRTARKNVKRSLLKLYKQLILSSDADYTDITDLASASRYVRKAYGATMATPIQVGNPWRLDVSLTVRKSGRRYLLIPYNYVPWFPKALRFLTKHPALADFHYQNQSDRPENIDARTWNMRAKVWARVLDEPEWSDFLTIDIVTLDGFYKIDPMYDFKMMKRYYSQSNDNVGVILATRGQSK